MESRIVTSRSLQRKPSIYISIYPCHSFDLFMSLGSSCNRDEVITKNLILNVDIFVLAQKSVLNFLYLCSWQVHFDWVLWWLRKVIVLRIIGILTLPWDFLCLYHVIPHIPISLMFSSLNLIFFRVWEAGTCTHLLEGHSEPVTSVSIINPGGS